MPNQHRADKRGVTNAKRWEINQRDAGEHVLTPEQQATDAAMKEVYARDFKAFYLDLIASGTPNKLTKKSHKETWGKIHDFMVDFLNIGSDDVQRYSVLQDYMPEKNEDGDYLERWLYWRALDRPPEVQDGPVGPLTDMFRDRFWQGVLIRVKGNGLSKCLLAPRGHLKSSIATQARSLWRIIRDPDSRTLIRSLTQDTAKMFCGDVKYAFEQNEAFRRLYGHMGEPPKGVAPWNADQLQVMNSQGKFKSRGKEYTLTSKGMESSLTSMHCDYTTLDDVVGEGNTETPALRADARNTIEQMMAIPDPGSPFEDIGTRWEDDDVHSMFIDPDRSDMEQDSSFMIATVLDGDDMQIGGEYVYPVPRHISPLGYGKPMWNEVYTLKEIARRRRAMRDDRKWYSQYFNQFMGTGLRTFSKTWIRHYEGNPLDVAAGKHLNIFIYFDTTSGKKIQSGKLDFTCGFVLGQTEDGRHCYVLDGFAEKIPSALMVRAIVNLSRKWHAVAEKYGGTFWSAVEESAYTNHLDTAIKLLLRQESVNKHVSIQGASHKNQQKSDRIAMLAQPYRDGMILWPRELVTHSSLNEPDVKQREENFEPYDFVQKLQEQFVAWPGTSNDDILDAHAGAFSRTNLSDFKNDPEEKRKLADPSRDDRSKTYEAEQSQLGEYGDRSRKWSLT